MNALLLLVSSGGVAHDGADHSATDLIELDPNLLDLVAVGALIPVEP